MSSRISHTTVDCHNAYELSAWWCQVLGYTYVPGDPNEAGDEECMIIDAGTGHQVLFIEVPDGKTAKNRVHFDLVPTDRARDAEVERVRAMGATLIADRRRPDGTGWAVLGDPEGNEFCVLRSDPERAATLRDH
jgi:hypothetical protein